MPINLNTLKEDLEAIGNLPPEEAKKVLMERLLKRREQSKAQSEATTETPAENDSKDQG